MQVVAAIAVSNRFMCIKQGEIIVVIYDILGDSGALKNFALSFN